ncbi:hypothetical protein [Aquirhabdus sp.]|uniref:hypothetical protein n=1 Tax=Aquirhabdus sp. TaxID=2824160 RepID=UPI00396CC78D
MKKNSLLALILGLSPGLSEAHMLGRFDCGYDNSAFYADRDGDGLSDYCRTVGNQGSTFVACAKGYRLGSLTVYSEADQYAIKLVGAESAGSAKCPALAGRVVKNIHQKLDLRDFDSFPPPPPDMPPSPVQSNPVRPQPVLVPAPSNSVRPQTVPAQQSADGCVKQTMTGSTNTWIYHNSCPRTVNVTMTKTCTASDAQHAGQTREANLTVAPNSDASWNYIQAYGGWCQGLAGNSFSIGITRQVYQ